MCGSSDAGGGLHDGRGAASEGAESSKTRLAHLSLLSDDLKKANSDGEAFESESDRGHVSDDEVHARIPLMEVQPSSTIDMLGDASAYRLQLFVSYACSRAYTKFECICIECSLEGSTHTQSSRNLFC
jgi:hypothetical protein